MMKQPHFELGEKWHNKQVPNDRRSDRHFPKHPGMGNHPSQQGEKIDLRRKFPLEEAVRQQNQKEILELAQDEENPMYFIVPGSGQLLLHWAMDQPDLELFHVLLARSDCNINVKDSSNCTALQLACSKGNVEIIKILLAREDIDVNPRILYTKEVRSPLRIAIDDNNSECVKLLLQRPEIDVNETKYVERYSYDNALIMACIMGHKELVQLLLEDPRTDVNVHSRDGMKTALNDACAVQQFELADMLLQHEGFQIVPTLNNTLPALEYCYLGSQTELISKICRHPTFTPPDISFIKGVLSHTLQTSEETRIEITQIFAEVLEVFPVDLLSANDPAREYFLRANRKKSAYK